MRIGVYGGSFDPPHLGHLLLAQSALEQLDLDRVLFVPAYRSPFKPDMDGAAAEERCAMVALSIEDNASFTLETFEAYRQEISYSCESVRHFAEQYPRDELYLLLGADAFLEFHQWREPDEILRRARLAVACRPGFQVDFGSHQYGAHATGFSMPMMEVSSSDIRSRVREGRSIRYRVPSPVEQFIESRGLYRTPRL